MICESYQTKKIMPATIEVIDVPIVGLKFIT
jgi:hypothetical protein